MLPQYFLGRFSLCCEWPRECGLIHMKLELMCLFRSAGRVFLRSILFQFQEKLLKRIPLLISFHSCLGTLKGYWQKMVYKWQWLFCFHLHLSLNDKKRKFLCGRKGEKGTYFRKVIKRRRDQKYFCWLTVWSPCSSGIKVRCKQEKGLFLLCRTHTASEFETKAVNKATVWKRWTRAGEGAGTQKLWPLHE